MFVLTDSTDAPDYQTSIRSLPQAHQNPNNDTTLNMGSHNIHITTRFRKILPKEPVSNADHHCLGQAQYDCDTCGLIFKSKLDFKQHILENNHTGQRLECALCNQAFELEISQAQSSEFKYHCNWCERSYKYRTSLQSHMQKHKGVERPKTKGICDLCGKVLSAGHIALHKKLVHEKGSTHMCHYCGAGFANNAQLWKHEKKHALAKKFECPICQARLSRKEQLDIHVQRHQGIYKTFPCMHCEKVFKKKVTLDDHMRSKHTGEKPFHCNICDRHFASRGSYGTHMVKHKEKNWVQCSECDYSTKYPKLMESHLARRHIDRTKHDDRPKTFVCDKCNRAFCSRRGLRRHIVRAHAEEYVKSLQCKYCGKIFKKQNDCEEHENVHTGAKPFMCEQCGLAFARKSALKQHIQKMHTDISSLPAKPCPICGKVFLYVKQFNRHVRTHDTKKVQCQYCAKLLSNTSTLTDHIAQIHMTEKKFNCDVCGKGFIKKYSLDCHLMMHSGDRPFQCSLCPKGFVTNWQLQHHLKTHGLT